MKIKDDQDERPRWVDAKGEEEVAPPQNVPILCSMHYTGAIEDVERMISKGRWNAIWCIREGDIVLYNKTIGNQMT